MKSLRIPLLSAFVVLITCAGIKAQTTQASGSQVSRSSADSSATFEINPVGPDRLNWHLKYGSQYKFKISHVNGIKLSGYTVAKPVNFESAAPALFSDTKLPGIPAAKTAVPNQLESLNTVAFNNTFKRKVRGYANNKQLAAKNKTLSEKNEALEKALKDLEDDQKENFITSYQAFVDNYRSLQRFIVAEDSLYKMLPDILVSDPEAVVNAARAYMLAVYDGADDSELESEINLTLKNLNENYLAVKSAYETLNGTGVSDASDITGPLKNASGSIVLTVSKASLAIKKDPQFLSEYTAATKIYNELNTGDTQARIFNKAFKGITLFRRIVRPGAFEVYTDSRQLLDDENQVTPSLKNEKGTIVKEFNPVTIKAFGGVKVDFSTGYLVTFRGDDNYAYYFENGTIKGVSRQRNNSLTNAIGALAHVYSRRADGVAVALSGGFSLTNNGDIGFYLGGSGLFLEKNRLALTAGISYVKAKLINKGNLDPVSGAPDKFTFNSTETVMNYDSLYKPGFFVGITYNIFSGPAKTAAK